MLTSALSTTPALTGEVIAQPAVGGEILAREGADGETDTAVGADRVPVGTAGDGVFEVRLMAGIIPAAPDIPGRRAKAEVFHRAMVGAFGASWRQKSHKPASMGLVGANGRSVMILKTRTIGPYSGVRRRLRRESSPRPAIDAQAPVRSPARWWMLRPCPCSPVRGGSSARGPGYSGRDDR
jgi:hypothetical protein